MGVGWGGKQPVVKRLKEENSESEANLGHRERLYPREGAKQTNGFKSTLFCLGSRESQFLWYRPVVAAFVGWSHGY